MRPSLRGRAVVAGGAALVLGWSTAAAAGRDLVVGERVVFETANGLPAVIGWALQGVMYGGTTLAAAVLIVIAFARRRPEVALAGFLAWFIARLWCTAMKEWIDRARPPGLLADVVLRQDLPDSAGFPSSHAATAFALAVVVAWAWPAARVPAYLGAVAMAVSRLYVGVHLPLDAVGGSALGIISGLAVVTCVDLVTTRRRHPGSVPTP